MSKTKSIFSKTHSIAAAATAAETPPVGVNGKPLSETLVVQHPAGTVLTLPEDQADDLVGRGFAVEYKEKEHKAVDGVVPLSTNQVITPPLPEGFTHPVVVRQDGTENDGSPGTTPASGVTVLRDTKDDAAKIAADKEAAEATTKAAKAAADKAHADKK